jgi:DNA sulfur modification protein DndB
MCPLRLIPKIFIFNEDELPPELRAQRVLNKNRVPEISRYIVGNRENYVFSALTASIDGEVKFEPTLESPEARRVGLLRIPMTVTFVINDGQHRRAAIEQALKEAPELGDETIAVVFFLDQGLYRSQQMFADLNRHAIRPSKSLGLLYDQRDDGALLSREIVFRTQAFQGLVEMERSTLSARSRKLFTFSAIHSATVTLLSGFAGSGEDRVARASDYWQAVWTHFPEWSLVKQGKLAASEVRRDFIHSHGITLQALGRVGRQIVDQPRWKDRLRKLQKIDWSRSNAAWEGRALLGGRVSKASHHVSLTTNFIKSSLGLALSADEARLEEMFARDLHVV